VEFRQLFNEVVRGRENAQRQFFELTSDKLMGVAVRYTYDRSTARDILQESYIRIFNKIPEFEYQSESALYSWMCKIVSREAIRWIKNNKRFDWNSEIPECADNRQQQISHELSPSDWLSCLAMLPENQRIVFNLYAIEGYNHREIEEITGIPEVTSRSTLSRARKKLQEVFKKKELV
jgi:RNA polymerase sigma factor (sigma-70 family)